MDAGNEATTINRPGQAWQMSFVGNGLGYFRLDVVGFLAVLGEGSMMANSQVSALSPLFYLPRIIPAPQALLSPTRPRSLPCSRASVTGVFSGNAKASISHVANVLLDMELMPFDVRCVQIRKRRKQSKKHVRVLPATMSWPGIEQDTQEATVTVASNGPLTWVLLLGCCLSIALLVSSLVFGDGMSFIATILLSLLSTLIGIANKWDLNLPQRPKADAPPGDTVIRRPNGSMLVVRCEEDVARELFFAPEGIKYKVSNSSVHRLISLLGTIFLMLSMIAPANARLQLQFAWTGAYIIINSAHWLAAAVPQRRHWDLSCYEVREEGIEGGPNCTHFTEALWKAIAITKEVAWVRNGDPALPKTSAWEKWLEEATEHAKNVAMEIGELKQPLFGDPTIGEGYVWMGTRSWDPKAAWNQLNSSEAN